MSKIFRFSPVCTTTICFLTATASSYFTKISNGSGNIVEYTRNCIAWPRGLPLYIEKSLLRSLTWIFPTCSYQLNLSFYHWKPFQNFDKSFSVFYYGPISDNVTQFHLSIISNITYKIHQKMSFKEFSFYIRKFYEILMWYNTKMMIRRNHQRFKT